MLMDRNPPPEPTTSPWAPFLVEQPLRQELQSSREIVLTIGTISQSVPMGSSEKPRPACQVPDFTTPGRNSSYFDPSPRQSYRCECVRSYAPDRRNRRDYRPILDGDNGNDHHEIEPCSSRVIVFNLRGGFRPRSLSLWLGREISIPRKK